MSYLREELRYINRQKIQELAKQVSKETELFNELLNLALSNEEYLSGNASIVLRSIADYNPDLIKSNIDKIINNTPKIQEQGQLGNIFEIFEVLKTDVLVLFDFFNILLSNPDVKPFLKIDILNILSYLAHIYPKKIKDIIDIIENSYDLYTTSYLQKTADVTLLELKDLELIEKKKKSSFL